ncbi:substrate-binding domain-containing protein [Arboricoccus pini]|uniref:substrate-binding domain-containing protein n=1 Tax=Arboricoccus pini TaxID=1963835 RepID=UPI001FAFCF9F|nr:substrate-binding domain-containing protein [Arboricoccus pini]
MVIHLEDLSPKGTADAILRLGEDCDALAGVCIDHPMVNAAVEKLAKANVPFWAMLSDLSTPARAGFVGANATKLGRSAGWFMHRLLPTGGRVAVLLGSSDYTAQCLYESGFRQYLSQKGSKIDILAPRETEENVEQAYALTRDILRIQPNLSGLFMAGGGIDGVIQALQDQHLTDMTLVSTELSEKTRTHLLQGSVDVALSHPAEVVATNVVHVMENNRPRGLDAMIVDVEHQIMVSESI